MTTNQIILMVVIILVCCVIIGVVAFLLIHRLKKNNQPVKQSKNIVTPKKEETPAPTVLPHKVEEDSVVEEIEEDKEDDFQVEEESERVVQVVNGHKVFVQYNYSFKAKLILASQEVQQQYKDIIHFVRSYGVKTLISWKQERIYLGRNTFAMLLFKGKKLCVAYALDPKEYVESKYKIIDLSEVKRFVKTPTVLKITSERKQKYAFELLDFIFSQNNLVHKEIEPIQIDIPSMTKEELIDENLIKVYTSDEITENSVVEQAKVSDLIRKNVTITEAKQLITDDSALEYVQVEEGTKKKNYTKKDIINLDVLSKNFAADELVNLETIKEKKLLSSKVDYVKVLGRGILDKPLIIEAQDFSIDAIKMIVLTGGEVRKVN